MTQQSGSAPVDDRPVRTAYGLPRDVERIQALVPDEPVEATVQVARAWHRVVFLVGVVIAYAWVVFADQQGLLRGRWSLAVVMMMFIVAWAPVAVSGLIRDRVSPLWLGAWQRGAVAVTPTRVLVVRRSFWTGRPVAVSRELDRATLPAALERRPWRFTTLRLRMPDGRTVPLRVTGAQGIAQRISTPLVIGPAGTRWSVDTEDSMRARLWSDGEWTATSDYLVNVQTAQVVIATT